jgi:transposase
VTSMNFIGLDIHKKTISYCVKDISGKVLSEGKIPATRQGLQEWVGTLAKPWSVAMEATMFTGWIYDYLRPHAAAVKVAHPLMLRAIAVAKKKNDRIDAGRIADCLRCDFLPECYMGPMEIRQRRRTLRYRKLLVRQNVQLKNKIAQLLMESGVSYNKEKLHQQGYFHQVLPANPEIDPSLWPLLKLTREMIERTQKTERALLRSLEADPLLATRVERLMTIPAIGHVTALTWVLEVGEAERFHSIKQVISYCGLCSGFFPPAETSRDPSGRRLCLPGKVRRSTRLSLGGHSSLTGPRQGRADRRGAATRAGSGHTRARLAQSTTPTCRHAGGAEAVGRGIGTLPSRSDCPPSAKTRSTGRGIGARHSHWLEIRRIPPVNDQSRKAG